MHPVTAKLLDSMQEELDKGAKEIAALQKKLELTTAANLAGLQSRLTRAMTWLTIQPTRKEWKKQKKRQPGIWLRKAAIPATMVPVPSQKATPEPGSLLGQTTSNSKRDIKENNKTGVVHLFVAYPVVSFFTLLVNVSHLLLFMGVKGL